MKTEDRKELRRATRKMKDFIMVAATGCVLVASLCYLVRAGVAAVVWLINVSVLG